VRGLQFYPATDGSAATYLWESDSVEAVQEYVDSTLGDSSVNTCWEVDAEKAFAEQPLGSKRPQRSVLAAARSHPIRASLLDAAISSLRGRLARTTCW